MHFRGFSLSSRGKEKTSNIHAELEATTPPRKSIAAERHGRGSLIMWAVTDCRLKAEVVIITRLILFVSECAGTHRHTLLLAMVTADEAAVPPRAFSTLRSGWVV